MRGPPLEVASGLSSISGGFLPKGFEARGFGARGFNARAAVQERSVQAQEDAKLGMREGQGPDEEGSKQTYDDGGACMLAASNCV